MSDEYTELERLAKGATPGPWKWKEIKQIGCIDEHTLEGPEVLCRHWKSELPVDGAYIAACSPEVVLKLIQKARAEKFFAERHARMTLEILDLRRVQTQLVEALEEMLGEKEDYMRINHLGDPDKECTNKLAKAALAATKETM